MNIFYTEKDEEKERLNNSCIFSPMSKKNNIFHQSFDKWSSNRVCADFSYHLRATFLVSLLFQSNIFVLGEHIHDIQ